MIRRRLTAADSMVVMAAFVLVGVSVGPTLRALAFRGLVERAVAGVEALHGHALDARARGGAWPTATRAGLAPPELGGVYAGDSALTFPGYALEWRTLSVVEFLEAPATTPSGLPGDAPPASVAREMIPSVRPLGAIVLHSSNTSLLAEMLARWGPGASFVRDTTWTILVGREPGEPTP